MATPAFSSTCLPQEATDFVRLFKIDVGSPIDVCDPTNPGYKLLDALTFMQGLDLTGPSIEPELDPHILGKDWIRRLVDLGVKIKWGPKTSEGCHRRLAFNWPGHKEIYLCPEVLQIQSRDLSLIQIAETLNHESRHVEGFRHTPCGEFSGCDVSIRERGAYAATVETFARIAVSGRNVTSRQRAIALQLARESARLNFTNPVALSPLPAVTWGIGLLTDQGRLLNFDGKDATPIFIDLPPIAQVLRYRASEAVALPAAPNTGLVPFTLQELSSPSAGIAGNENYDKFKEIWKLFSAKDKAKLRGMTYHYVKNDVEKIVYALLIGNEVRVVFQTSRGTKRSTFVLPEGRPMLLRNQLLESDNYDPNDLAFYILSDLERLYRLEFTIDGEFSLREVANPYAGFRDVRILGNRVYLLDGEGRLFVDEGQGRTYLVESLAHLRFRNIVFPTFIQPMPSKLVAERVQPQVGCSQPGSGKRVGKIVADRLLWADYMFSQETGEKVSRGETVEVEEVHLPLAKVRKANGLTGWVIPDVIRCPETSP